MADTDSPISRIGATSWISRYTRWSRRRKRLRRSRHGYNRSTADRTRDANRLAGGDRIGRAVDDQVLGVDSGRDFDLVAEILAQGDGNEFGGVAVRVSIPDHGHAKSLAAEQHGAYGDDERPFSRQRQVDLGVGPRLELARGIVHFNFGQ